MKTKLLIILLSILMLSACIKNTIVDDTSFVNDSNSRLVPLLLSRDDFNTDWKVGYGEIAQHLGGVKDVDADEYARYFFATTYLPYNTYFTFSHEIYLHINTKVDANIFLNFEKEGIQWVPSKNLDFSIQSTRCIKYLDSDKQSCVIVEDNDFLTSVFFLTISSHLSDEQINDAIAPIIKAINVRLKGYKNK